MARHCLHKFGGSSLADADCYRRVAHILLTQGQSDDLIVVSAAGDSTNTLYHLLSLSDKGFRWQESLHQFVGYQRQLIEQLLGPVQASDLCARLAEESAELQALLSLANRSQYQINQAVSLGERWSSRLMAALLAEFGVKARSVDARSILIAEEGAVPQIKTQISRDKIQALLAAYPDERLVITGFICASETGETLLLGRNGSDYSATLIASLADIEQVTIWTDVEGVFNADPNKINDARLLESMSLVEADRLARLGSPVLHSRTLQPLFGTQICLAVRSSYAPHTSYTQVAPSSSRASAPVVTSVEDVACIALNLSNDGEALLGHLARVGIAPLAFWNTANGKLELAYMPELQRQALQQLDALAPEYGISGISLSRDLGLVALVSADAQLYRRGFARLLNRDARPLYQDELSLATLVQRQQVTRLTREVHRRCAGPRKRIGVVLLGVGNIGEAWLDLFRRAASPLGRQLEASIELLGLVNSSRALIDNGGIDAAGWRDRFTSEAEEWCYPELFARLEALECDELVALDISASSALTEQYPELFARGIHLVSANKAAGSGSLSFYRQLKQQLANRRLYWRYNASCGAGLPVQHALNDLQNSGDTVEAIGGVFSGTLCWLFEHYDGVRSFSDLLLEAKALGITEPDPRDDLSGRDMQRKLLILAREIGMELELEDIEVDSPIPPELASLPQQEFLQRISELDEPMEQVLTAAREQGKVLRYVAALDRAGGQVNARVGLQWLAPDHPWATLTPGDNVFVIRSAFYQGNPLIIRGPGAGREVTAAAVQSDLAQICQELLLE